MVYFSVMRIAFVLGFILTITAVVAQPSKVMTMEIKDDIDPRMSRYVKLALEHAESIKADVVIIEMDTYGGMVTDAKDIVENLLNFDIPVWVFIDKDAASAGALISIACDSIYMAPGASIGAATVVMGTGGEAAPDKYQSYMRSTMRSTAEETGRDPKIAEGMVDENIEIEGVTEEGSVITFSTSEAIEHGFCEGKVSSIEEILEKNGYTDHQLIKFERSSTESIIAFFLNPFISGILIMVIVGGIYFELQTPGVGFPILAAGVALILYLVPYYLNGLAENWEILMFIIGIILIGVEIFVIPGFGIAGVLGIGMVFVSLTLMMLNNDAFNFELVPLSSIINASFTVLGALFGAVLIMFFGGVRLTRSKVFERVALMGEQHSDEGYTSSFYSSKDLVGKKGIVFTRLRPSGKVLIEDELYDAYTRGSFIEKDEKVIVISSEGTSLKVKKSD